MMEQNATNLPIPNEFDDDTDFWSHEICNNYEANRQGVVRNKFTKNQVGFEMKDGYLRFTCNNSCCRGNMKNKKNNLHRFVFECFFGLIEDGKVVDHIDNNPSNNKLENLQLITKSENISKDYKKRDLTAQKIRAINVKTGEVFIYKSQNGAAVDLGINSGSICYVLSGTTKTALSKKYNERYTFQKIDHDNETLPLVIINKNKINNIKAKVVKITKWY